MKNTKTNCRSRITRRKFLVAATSITGFTIVPRHVLGGPGSSPPSETLNVACIGAGGKGYFNIIDVGRAGGSVVALCDVDEKRAGTAFEQFPKATRYSDLRRLLDQEKNIDAVVVSTPDHVHIPASVMAMRMGKHVYCEKPLGQNIAEIRLATQVARENGVVTQMGNGAHSGPNYRGVAKMVKEGVIGEVREVYCWCDDDKGMPPDNGKLAWGDRPPPQTPPVPEHLRWDLWLGPAPHRPYHPTYHPLHWRDWWAFGNGRLGDMGCHMIDLPFSALDLKYPLTVEAQGPRQVGNEVAPRWLLVQWAFAWPGGLPPVILTWYHGGKRPPLQKEHNMPDWPEATLFVGSKGMLIADYGRFKLYPEERSKNVQRPRFDDLRGHHEDWVEACKAGYPTRPGCHFGYAGPLAETVLLGTVAYRAGRKLEWDPVNLKATNCPEAEAFIRRKNREGWAV